MKLVRLAWFVVALAAAVAGAGGLYLLSIVGRPPMPLEFGQRVWDYECGFTVSHVARTHRVGAITARGTFYLVTARVDCPFGERYHWDPTRAYVIDNRGIHGNRYDYSVDGQRAFDRLRGRPPTPHTILGASETEYLVFDLPTDIEQPALVFTDTLTVDAFLGDWMEGKIYEPHRFNLRYD